MLTQHATVSPDAAVAAAPPAPTDLAWRVIGLVNLYRLLVPPSLYALYAFSGSAATLGGARPQLFLWMLHRVLRRGCGHRGRRAAPVAQSACQPLSCTRWSTRSPSACSCSRAVASRAASASCSWCRSAPWRCWRTAATPSCWPPSPRLRCSRSRSAAMCSAALTATTTHHRHPGRHRLPRGAARLADRAPPARHRGDGATAAGGPGEPRPAVAVHRPAPAREHRRGGSREPHPPDQRNRGARCSATRAPIRAPCSAKRRRSFSIYWRPGARAPRHRPRRHRPSWPPMAGT